MITIEEVIISSLYHRLVLVRVKKVPDVEENVGDDVDVGNSNKVVATNSKGLGFLSLGGLSQKNAEDKSPPCHSVETRSLEMVEKKVAAKMIRVEEEEVFIKKHIGMMISVGELHRKISRPKMTTEVQTETDPLWTLDCGTAGLSEQVFDMRNCNEFSLARIEAIGDENNNDKIEKKALLMLESKSNDPNTNENECFFKSIESSALEDDMDNKVKMLEGVESGGKVTDKKAGLVGSYKIYNMSSDGHELKMENHTNEIENGEKVVEEREEEKRVMMGCEGIGEVLMPSSYVDFVVHRIENDTYQNENRDFKDSGIDFSGVKFHHSRDGESRFASRGSHTFKGRRRVSKRRSQSSRKTVIDGDKLLRHMMTCVGNEKASADLITITDFKLSPKHAFRSLNSSHADLRQHVDSEFNSPHSSAFSTPANKPHKSLSERSSPLMMTLPRQHSTTHTTSQPPSNDSSLEWNNEVIKSISFFDDPSNLTCNSSFASPAHIHFEKFPDWMKKLPTELKSTPLNLITIPGSHISLAIDRDMKISCDFSQCNVEMADFLRKLPNLPVFNNFRNQMKLIWRAWMSKQCLGVYHQLQAGSRYLDMRVSKNNHLLVGAHGLFTGHLKRYLKEIRLFIEEQPSEVVIVHITPSDSLSPHDRKQIVTLLFQVFGTKMASRKNKMATDDDITIPSIESLLQDNKQVLVVMPTTDVIHHVSKHIFGGAVWPDSCLRVISAKKQTIHDLRTSLDDLIVTSVPEEVEKTPQDTSLVALETSSTQTKATSSSSSSSYVTAKRGSTSSSSNTESSTTLCSPTKPSHVSIPLFIPKLTPHKSIPSNQVTQAIKPPQQASSCLAVTQAVWQPDMSTVFGKYDNHKSMKELSIIETTPIIIDWLSEKKEGVNIIAVDFIGCPGLVAAILQNNNS